ncbi:MAG TPA: diacylglycerol kinase family protein [Micromonosporaceae bacterium]|jgi:diacylglycerol kinase family enzyme
MSTRVAVIAHTGKTLDGGLDELRRLITGEEIDELIWYEVPKSRKAPKKVRKALDAKPDLLVIWGGDGMVQRCLDTVALAEAEVRTVIIPAGTANLFAHNLDIPEDLAEAVRIGFHGRDRRIDLGRLTADHGDAEHFAVMAGVGFDANMIDDADGSLKDRLGRLAYIWTGAKEIGLKAVPMKIKLDGTTWFDGDATCVLVGNVAKVFGPVEVFEGATPDDGWLDIGVTTAQGPVEWSRALARISTGPSDKSPYVRTARAKRISVKLAKPLRFEVDGGARTKVSRVRVAVVAGVVTARVPA